MSLTKTHPSFQSNINKIAATANETPEAVYAKWRKYSEDCRNFDQSPVMFEFCNWHGYQDPRKDGEF